MDKTIKGFWNFCCEHPIALVFIASVLIGGVGDIASAITVHFEHDSDGFWFDTKHTDGELCKQTRKDGHYCIGAYMDNSCECVMDDLEK